MAQGKSATATATAEAPTDGTTGEGAATPKANARPNRSYIVMPLPADLKARFEEEAKVKDVPVGPYVRDLLAGYMGITIPATVSTRRSKYASDEERKAAQTQRNQSRSQTMRNLMAQFREMQKNGVSAEDAARLASAAVISGAATANGASAKPAEELVADATPA